MASYLDGISLWAKDRLEADPAFAGQTILVQKAIHETAKDLFEDLLTEALRANGVCLAFPLQVGRVLKANVDGPYFDYELAVEVWFNPHHSQSSSRTTIQEWVEKVMAVLQFTVPEDTGAALTPLGYSVAEDGDIEVARVTFFAGTGFTYTVNQVAAPTVTSSGGTLTGMSTVTSGASIYWTSDGNFPVQTSNLWTGAPVVVGVGVEVKARAFKSGWRASEITYHTTTSSLTNRILTEAADNLATEAGDLLVTE